MFTFVTSKQPHHKILHSYVFNLECIAPLVSTVSQLQQTLVSIQELLTQQQQKIQELSQELSVAEVTMPQHQVITLQLK